MPKAHPLNNYIRSARLESGLTQHELAYLVGRRGARQVSRFELFQREPTLITALACQFVLGTPHEELFAGTYQDAISTAKRRAKLLDMKLQRLSSSRLVERKRETLRRILESGVRSPDASNES